MGFAYRHSGVSANGYTRDCKIAHLGVKARKRVSVKSRIITAAAAAALALAATAVTRFEGTRYAAYQDFGGVWTICQGHTHGVKPGDTASKEQCAAYLNADLGMANDAIDRCVSVPLSVGERAAYIDLIFNIGDGAFCRSTLVRVLNSGDHKAACEQLMRWTHAGGKQLQGLVERRKSERDLCLKGPL